MNKQEFLISLRAGLKGLPQADIDDRTTFYSEMIDDKMEDGLSEDEAVAGIGPVDKVISQILEDTPLQRIVGEKLKTKSHLSWWAVLLLVLGSPIWLSLVIAAFAVLLSLIVTIWAVCISFWAADLAILLGGIGGITAGIVALVIGRPIFGGATLGASVTLLGLSILFFFVCKGITYAAIFLVKKTILGIKRMFVGKETKQ